MEDTPLPPTGGAQGAEATATPPSGLAGAGPAEAAAWADVQARWSDKAAHLAYLARFPDLDGLTTAGRRYRDALAARPGDGMALAMKAEVLKRATVVGLAMLPRTSPPVAASSGWRRALVFIMAMWLVMATGWMAWKLFAGPTP